MKTQPAIGETYDRLTVEAQERRRGTAKLYRCRCVCGKTVHVSAGDLRRWKTEPRHRTMSCGCARSESVRDGRFNAGLCTQGGQSTRREYTIWRGMARRCFDPNQKAYKDYGGRGISMCSRWKNSFPEFLSDMGACPDGYTIERINNDGHYSPDNCKWASRMEQGANSRQCRLLAMDGETLHMSEWARRFGIQVATLKHRIDHQGMTLKTALTTKVREAQFSATNQPVK